MFKKNKKLKKNLKDHFWKTHFSCLVSYLDHAVTVGIGDVWLQAGKQGSIVMFEVKIF